MGSSAREKASGSRLLHILLGGHWPVLLNVALTKDT